MKHIWPEFFSYTFGIYICVIAWNIYTDPSPSRIITTPVKAIYAAISQGRGSTRKYYIEITPWQQHPKENYAFQVIREDFYFLESILRPTSTPLKDRERITPPKGTKAEVNVHDGALGFEYIDTTMTVFIPETKGVYIKQAVKLKPWWMHY